MKTWHDPLANGKARHDGSFERLASGSIAAIAWAAGELRGASEVQETLVQEELKQSLERVWTQEAAPNREAIGNLASEIVRVLRQAHIEGNAPEVTLALSRSVLNNIPKQETQASELLDAIVNSNFDSSILNQLDLLAEVVGETRHASLLYFYSLAVWANLGHPDERSARAAALNRIQIYCLGPYLNFLDLTSLPPLHSELGVLNAAGNHLTHLQEVLPEKLREIDVSENKLETLPDLLPEGLESIDISDNPLVELPESIKALDSDVEVTARWIPEEVYQELDLAVFRGKVRCQVDCSGTVYSG